MNFKELDDLIHSGVKEIVLDSDVIENDMDNYGLLEGITIDVDDLVIDGQDHIIDARRERQIFQVTGKNIVLKNITFKNGKNHFGGAIENNGELHIINSCFRDNKGFKDGGAIQNRGKLEISNSFFKNNLADEIGGAIYNLGELTLQKCSFKHNSSLKEGYAIYSRSLLLLKIRSVINMEECSFVANTKRVINPSSNQFFPFEELFKRKRPPRPKAAEVITSALHNASDSLIFIYDSEFVENDGAILNGSSSRIIVEGTSFEANTSKHEGAAIFNMGECVVNESCFKKNKSYNEGGAIANIGAYDFLIGKSVFEVNSSDKSGGAIWCDNQKLDMIDCTFRDNSPDDIDSYE